MRRIVVMEVRDLLKDYVSQVSVTIVNSISD